MILKVNNQLITKTYLDKALNKAIGSIAEILNDLIQKMEKRFDRVEGRLDRVEGRLDRVEGRLGQVETSQQDIKRQLTDLKMDTPTQREFEELKIKVNRIRPTL